LGLPYVTTASRAPALWAGRLAQPAHRVVGLLSLPLVPLTPPQKQAHEPSPKQGQATMLIPIMPRSCN